MEFGQPTKFSNFKIDFEKTPNFISFVDVDCQMSTSEYLPITEAFAHSISHRKLPNWDTHSNFVKNNPYRAWYIVYSEGIVIGSIYVQHDNSVGIDIDISEINISFDPLRGVVEAHSTTSRKSIKGVKMFLFQCGSRQ